MVYENNCVCPKCGGELKYYDKCERIYRTTNRKTAKIQIRRLKCMKDGSIHRELPTYLKPFKQYEKEVIDGVVEGFITPDTLGYQDYPCEMTMHRWITHESQLL